MGGYREGTGRSKHGHYRGIFCGSTYELAFLIYHLDHGSPIERYPTYFEYIDEGGTTRKYFPDFVIGGQIYEIKGRYTDVMKAKMANFPQVKVLLKEDLAEVFDHVRERYGLCRRRLHELYDDAAPSFTYTCACCGSEFTTFKKRKKNVVLCSRVCAGKFISPIGRASRHPQG